MSNAMGQRYRIEEKDRYVMPTGHREARVYPVDNPNVEHVGVLQYHRKFRNKNVLFVDYVEANNPWVFKVLHEYLEGVAKSGGYKTLEAECFEPRTIGLMQKLGWWERQDNGYGLLGKLFLAKTVRNVGKRPWLPQNSGKKESV